MAGKWQLARPDSRLLQEYATLVPDMFSGLFSIGFICLEDFYYTNWRYHALCFEIALRVSPDFTL